MWVCVWGMGVMHKCSHLICLKKQKESEQDRPVIARTSVCLGICGTNTEIFGYSTQKVNFYCIYCVPPVNYIGIIFFINSRSESHQMCPDNMQTGCCCNKSIGIIRPKHKTNSFRTKVGSRRMNLAGMVSE